MKKVLFALLISAFSSAIYAQNLGDIIDNLGNEISFGYTTTDKISIKEINDDKIIIESPVIKTSNGETITKYTVMYSEYSLIEVLDQTDLLNQTKEKSYELTGTQSPFTMEIGVSDGIDISKKYYFFVSPKDASGKMGELSNELRFNISNKTYGDAGSDQIQTANTPIEHNAAGADMSLANITHTINGNNISLLWISVAGSETIDISVMTPGSSSFNRVATVNMDDENYSFVANRNGEYIFQFTPDNGGRQVNYTIQINTINTPTNGGTTTTTGITKVPKTGPAENILLIIAITAITYLIYKKMYKKAK